MLVNLFLKFCSYINTSVIINFIYRRHLSEHVETSYHPCHLKSIGFNCNYCHFILWTKEKLSEHELCRHSEHASETYLLCQYCFFSCNNLVIQTNTFNLLKIYLENYQHNSQITVNSSKS